MNVEAVSQRTNSGGQWRGQVRPKRCKRQHEHQRVLPREHAKSTGNGASAPQADSGKQEREAI